MFALSEVIGIVPGAGRASRIGGFFKELTPINVSELDSSHFVVVSERIIELISSTGAAPIYFVLNTEKQLISEYFGRANLFPGKRILYANQDNTDQYYGMPFAIDAVYYEARGKTVLLGMPDTLIEPDNSFKILLQRFRTHNADLELGLFKAKRGNFGGFVEFDRDTLKVLNHIDKTSPEFPSDRADNAWAIACWNGRFTEFMHNFIENKRNNYKNSGNLREKELLFGDIIDAAISSKEFNICADFISKDEGYYLDITEPKKYFEAVLHYHESVVDNRYFDGSRNVTKLETKIFISHSSIQKKHAEKLHKLLKSAGFYPILDAYDISPGQNILNRVEQLINESSYFILLLTKESLSSNWVSVEIALAYAKGMVKQERLCPVQIGEIDENEANSQPFIPKNTYNWLDGTSDLTTVVTWIEMRFERANS